MTQPQHRVPGTRRRFIASALAVGCIGSGLGVMGIAVAAQPPMPVLPAGTAPAAAGNATTAAAPAIGALTGLAGAAGAAADPGAAAPQPEDSWARAATPEEEAGAIDAGVLPASEPVSLAIPSIDVDSPIHDLGLDAGGGLEVPQGPHYDDAAWFRHSPTPGELGPAVLLGHVDSAANGPSVFFRLGELAAGDLIEVIRADGSAAVFAVDAVHRYAKSDFPTDLVYGDLDHAGLRILTCGGAFDRSARSYVDNVVVFASLV
jgi:hypothetical protein